MTANQAGAFAVLLVTVLFLRFVLPGFCEWLLSERLLRSVL